MIRRPPRSPLFPYPPLFRSLADVLAEHPPHVEPQQWHLPRLAHRLGYQRLAADSQGGEPGVADATAAARDRKSTRLNSSHLVISYAVFCFKKKKIPTTTL